MKRYPVMVRELDASDGGGFLAEVPDLPGCMGDGETPEEALANVASAIAEWIETAQEMGRPVPEPDSLSKYSGRWVQRVPKSLHQRLADAAKREGVSLNALATALLAEGLGKRRPLDEVA